jgi:hypothetical protein
MPTLFDVRTYGNRLLIVFDKVEMRRIIVVIYKSKVYTRTYCPWNTISVTKHDLSVERTEMHSFG